MWYVTNKWNIPLYLNIDTTTWCFTNLSISWNISGSISGVLMKSLSFDRFPYNIAANTALLLARTYLCALISVPIPPTLNKTSQYSSLDSINLLHSKTFFPARQFRGVCDILSVVAKMNPTSRDYKKIYFIWKNEKIQLIYCLVLIFQYTQDNLCFQLNFKYDPNMWPYCYIEFNGFYHKLIHNILEIAEISRYTKSVWKTIPSS